MSDLPDPVRSLGRGFLFGAAAVGAGAVLAACTGNDRRRRGHRAGERRPGGGDNAKPGTRSRSASPRPPPTTAGSPRSPNAKAQAEQFKDVTLNAARGHQRRQPADRQVETLISQKVDALVILPFDGKR